MPCKTIAGVYHDRLCEIHESSRELESPAQQLLGKLISELQLDEFVTSGPKSYGYLKSGEKCCLKVKGIALNATKREKIHFQSLRDLVLDYGINPDTDDPKKIVTKQCSIIRNMQK